MRLVAYDPSMAGRYLPATMPGAMRIQLDWLNAGAGLTVYLPCSEKHPQSTTYSAGALAKVTADPDDIADLANPGDRSIWIATLCMWAWQITEGLVTGDEP